MSKSILKCVQGGVTSLRPSQVTNRGSRHLSMSAQRMASGSSRPSSNIRSEATGSSTDFSKLLPNASRDTIGTLSNMFPAKARTALDEADDIETNTNYHFTVYSTKHNTHIAVTRPNRNPMLSLSCGNLGFRKANRGTYESAYQLAAYVLAQITNRGWLAEMKDVELIFRGFGDGRLAVTKAIMGTEGTQFRPHICRVTDSTRLKQGGTRAPKPRRLG